MKTPLRVHICPVGFEVQRVADPLGRMRADKAYLVTYRADDPARQCVAKIKEDLLKKNSGIQVIEEYVNIWNLVDCIAKFKEIIRKERDNAVYINVSTGSGGSVRTSRRSAAGQKQLADHRSGRVLDGSAEAGPVATQLRPGG